MREVFSKSQLLNYQASTKGESIACTSDGRKIFVGTPDGSVQIYQCLRGNSSGISEGRIVDTIKRREKKLVSLLRVVESWNVVLGIVDSLIVAYDVNSLAPISQLPELKGTIAFTVNERALLLVVAAKRKITILSWHLAGFVFKKEIPTTESVKCLLCYPTSIVTGFKKHYDMIDIPTTTFTKLLDFEREHKMSCVELPQTSQRPAVTLLTTGNQGCLIDISNLQNQGGSMLEEQRIEWSTAPNQLTVTSPFLVSLLQDSVEVHDIYTLSSLQRIKFVAPSIPLSLYLCDNVSVSTNTSVIRIPCCYVLTSDSINILTLIPLSVQVTRLVESGNFEEALALCGSCPPETDARMMDVDVSSIHERYGTVLYQKGDFDGAITNYLIAKTDIILVFMLFPDLVPQSVLQQYISSCGVTYTSLLASNGSSTVSQNAPSSSSKLSTIILHRAASALVNFCEQLRQKTTELADKAEISKATGVGAGFGGASDILSSSILSGFSNPFETQSAENVLSADDLIRRSVLLDTVLINSLVASSSLSSTRKNAVIEVLASNNRCHIEHCAVLLASQGNSFTEALLWLFRSHGEHKRVLSALSEDRCVGAGAWSREMFYQWYADYLLMLWYSDDITHPMLVLPALKPVLEYDAELGLRALIGGGKKHSSFGGKGVTVQEVVTFLESVIPRNSSGSNSDASKWKSNAKSNYSKFLSTHFLPPSPPIPLLNGRALSIAYLEWLVSSGSAPSNMHDDYAQLLMEGVPLEDTIDHMKNDIELRDDDSEGLRTYKVYRSKLQIFLQASNDYHPDRILKFLPSPLLHEYALLLSKLGRHEEVLTIYIHRLSEYNTAEIYCDRIYNKAISHRNTSNMSYNKKGGANNASIASGEEVYLCLLQVLLGLSKLKQGSNVKTPNEALHLVIDMAEKYVDRVDSCAFLDILPPTASLSMLHRYLAKSIENSNSSKRNLQVVHQLLKVREVNLRTKDF